MLPPKEYLGFAMKASLDGFTMIEIVVVMAIVAILVLLAVPTFQGKIIKDQIVEAGPLADVAKKKVAVVWEATQTLPPDNLSAGLPVPDRMVSNVVSSVAVEGGAIHVTFGNRAHQALQGKILTFRPGIVEDSPIVPIAWICGFARVPEKMIAKGENRTNIPATSLPYNCWGG